MAAALTQGWGYAFVIPGFAMVALALLMFLFLVVSPSDVGVSENGTRPADTEDTVRCRKRS